MHLALLSTFYLALVSHFYLPICNFSHECQALKPPILPFSYNFSLKFPAQPSSKVSFCLGIYRDSATHSVWHIKSMWTNSMTLRLSFKYHQWSYGIRPKLHPELFNQIITIIHTFSPWPKNPILSLIQPKLLKDGQLETRSRLFRPLFVRYAQVLLLSTVNNNTFIVTAFWAFLRFRTI